MLGPLFLDRRRSPRSNSLDGRIEEDVENEMTPKAEAATNAVSMSRLQSPRAEESEHLAAEARAKRPWVKQKEGAEEALGEIARSGHGVWTVVDACGGRCVLQGQLHPLRIYHAKRFSGRQEPRVWESDGRKSQGCCPAGVGPPVFLLLAPVSYSVPRAVASRAVASLSSPGVCHARPASS